MPKIHQIYPAKNRYFCGCCIAGPVKDLSGMLCIHFCSLLVLVPFCVFVAKQNLESSPALPIVLFISVAFMYFFLYLTACTDPGIIPRRAFLQRQPEKNRRFLVQQSSNPTVRVCETCFVIRPRKTSHCSSCGNCVQIFDHHCGIIGTCIGKRNYRYFIMFLGFVVLSAALLIINMVLFFISKSAGSISQIAVIVIVSIVGGIIGIPILGFFIFHLYLAITRNTTREVLKHIKTQNQQIENQWCDVDPPNINFFEQISEQQARGLTESMQKMQKPIVYEPQIKVAGNEPEQNLAGQNSEIPLT